MREGLWDTEIWGRQCIREGQGRRVKENMRQVRRVRRGYVSGNRCEKSDGVLLNHTWWGNEESLGETARDSKTRQPTVLRADINGRKKYAINPHLSALIRARLHCHVRKGKEKRWKKDMRYSVLWVQKNVFFFFFWKVLYSYLTTGLAWWL